MALNLILEELINSKDKTFKFLQLRNFKKMLFMKIRFIMQKK